MLVFQVTGAPIHGSLPASWGSNGSFKGLGDLEVNGLSGTLPAEWGSPTAFQQLSVLTLSKCNLTGMIAVLHTSCSMHYRPHLQHVHAAALTQRNAIEQYICSCVLQLQCTCNGSASSSPGISTYNKLRVHHVVWSPLQLAGCKTLARNLSCPAWLHCLSFPFVTSSLPCITCPLLEALMGSAIM